MKLPSILLAAALALTGCEATGQSYTGSPSYSVKSYSGGPTRSPGARAAFVRDNPCPATGRRGGACPGYEVDHIRPLAAGGADHKSNMQWLSKSQHRAKTKAERKACVYGCGKKKK